MSQQLSSDDSHRRAEPDVPKGFFSYLRSFGPGIVVAMSWVGTGDLIDNSVAGGNYGYALLWVLPLAVVLRFVFVNALGKYVLFNVRDDPSLIRGLARLHPAMGWLLLISFVLYTHLLMSFSLSAVGVAINGLTGGAVSAFVGALIGAGSVFLVTARGVYQVLENVLKGVLAIKVVTFIVAIVLVGVSWRAMLGGLAFDFPEQSGPFDATLVAASLVLATIGSMANLFYPEFLREKGWLAPRYRRLQQYDLLFGSIVVLFLGGVVWVLGAEVLHGAQGVSEASDIADALASAIGPVGAFIFYFGLLGAGWTVVAGSVFALGKMVVESLHVVRPQREGRYPERGKDPVYIAVVIWGLSAVLWSLPGGPGFIPLVVIAHVLTAPFLVLIVIGVITLLNSRHSMGPHRNSWKENIALGLVATLVCIAAVQGFVQAFTTMF
ncbi:Nramp family divalent metal transporter [Saccharopolyspora sp. K220]|uniref:Nramp family divalent metal transporter n=1 Tax=Saccharopolyspora soli TaxID=2926618 RepID=UPI001F56EE86|nr:Nramp family divalent metal transporter [Saccharopolyspora soli]MCI2416513.1 Nramp family divalent metal transporter [Saccharopolyspora soli]